MFANVNNILSSSSQNVFTMLSNTNTTKLFTTFPYLQTMDIVLRIEAALAGDGNMVAFSLKQAIETKQPDTAIVRYCKDMIRDNETAMAYMLGQSLVDKIKMHRI
jgi:hypothetical protein